MSAARPEERVHLLVKIRAVVCPMLVNLIVGAYYCYGNINPYVAAYLNSKAVEDGGPEVTEADTLLIMPVWIFCQAIFGILSVRLADYVGFWLLNIVAFACVSLVHLAASFVTGYGAFIVVYGVGSGMSFGLGFVNAVYISWTYFPKHKSVVTGAILFCSGISGVILSPLTTLIANPDNVSVQDIRSNSDVYGRVPRLFRLMAAYFGALALVGSLLQPHPLQSRRLEEKQASKRRLRPEPRRPEAADPEKQGELRSQLRELAAPDAELEAPAELRRLERRELVAEVKTGLNEQTSFVLVQLDGDRVEDLLRENAVVREATASVRFRGQASTQRDEACEAGESRVQRLAGELEANECPSFAAGLRSGAFLHLCGMAFCVSMYNYFLNASWKKFYPSQFEVEDAKFALLLSIGALSNSLVRLGVGLMLLKLVCAALAALGAFTVCRVATSYELAAVYLAFAFGGLGAQVTLFPTICMEVFGALVGLRMYPCIYFVFSAASLSQFAVLKLAGDRYELMCNIFGTVALLGFVLGAFFNPKFDWSKQIQEHHAQQALEEAKLAQSSKQR